MKGRVRISFPLFAYPNIIPIIAIAAKANTIAQSSAKLISKISLSFSYFKFENDNNVIPIKIVKAELANLKKRLDGFIRNIQRKVTIVETKKIYNEYSKSSPSFKAETIAIINPTPTPQNSHSQSPNPQYYKKIYLQPQHLP